jgi:hypothetical protein
VTTEDREVINELLLEVQNLRGWHVWPPPRELPPAVKRAFALLHGSAK